MNLSYRPLFAVLFGGLLGAAALCTISATASAQTYPEKPVKLVVGFSPGGALDVAARIMAQKMSDGLGRAVIVENRSGAGGTIANDYVAKSEADGHTLLMIGAIFAVQAAI